MSNELGNLLLLLLLLLSLLVLMMSIPSLLLLLKAMGIRLLSLLSLLGVVLCPLCAVVNQGCRRLSNLSGSWSLRCLNRNYWKRLLFDLGNIRLDIFHSLLHVIRGPLNHRIRVVMATYCLWIERIIRLWITVETSSIRRNGLVRPLIADFGGLGCHWHDDRRNSLRLGRSNGRHMYNGWLLCRHRI